MLLLVLDFSNIANRENTKFNNEGAINIVCSVVGMTVWLLKAGIILCASENNS